MPSSFATSSSVAETVLPVLAVDEEAVPVAGADAATNKARAFTGSAAIPTPSR